MLCRVYRFVTPHRLLLQNALQADAALHNLAARAGSQALVAGRALLLVCLPLGGRHRMQRVLAAHLLRRTACLQLPYEFV